MGMAEYIEREALEIDLNGRLDFLGDLNGIDDHYTMGFFEAVIRAKEFPSADVAPVRHGRWLTWEEQFPGSTPKKQSGLGVFCDKCHSHADNRTDYCPNCGAKMDGSSNEE